VSCGYIGICTGDSPEFVSGYYRDGWSLPSRRILDHDDINYWAGSFIEKDYIKDKRVLDVSAGLGLIANTILLSEPSSLKLSELSSYRADYLTKKYSMNENVAVLRGSVEEISGLNESFDLIILYHVLEHIPDPELSLRQLAKLLSPNGLLYVSIPFYTDDSLFVYGFNHAHLHAFNFQNFQLLVRRAGLSVQRAKLNAGANGMHFLLKFGECRPVLSTPSIFLEHRALINRKLIGDFSLDYLYKRKGNRDDCYVFYQIDLGRTSKPPSCIVLNAFSYKFLSLIYRPRSLLYRKALRFLHRIIFGTYVFVLAKVSFESRHVEMTYPFDCAEKLLQIKLETGAFYYE
jgi:SAM-dependent methyltransferase